MSRSHSHKRRICGPPRKPTQRQCPLFGKYITNTSPHMYIHSRICAYIYIRSDDARLQIGKSYGALRHVDRHDTIVVRYYRPRGRGGPLFFHLSLPPFLSPFVAKPNNDYTWIIYRITIVAPSASERFRCATR